VVFTIQARAGFMAMAVEVERDVGLGFSDLEAFDRSCMTAAQNRRRSGRGGARRIFS